MRVVRSGRWVYDGSIELTVDIVALDHDLWYETSAADGLLDEGEEPMPLGADGVLYYVRFARASRWGTPVPVDSRGFSTLTEAVQEAEARTPTPIRWSET